jgi:copper(I)-binding protein
VPSTQAEQEAVVNRLTNRLVAASAGLAASGLILTGCGAGQISQTADQQSAVNGATANVANIALRNIHLQALQTGAALPAGQTVELIFVAANISPDTNDKLISISSDVGTVAVTGATAIPAGTSLIVGSAEGQAEATPLGSAEPTKAAVTLTQPITNGLTYKFTFDFDKAGETTVSVPIAAGGPAGQEGDSAGGHH